MANKTKKLFAWKEAVRTAIEKMEPAGFIELPNNKFLVMFDRELLSNEKEKTEAIGLKYKASGYAYTFNRNAKLRPIMAFEANIIALYDEMVIYDREVEAELLAQLKDLKFKFKTRIDLYEIEYKG